MRAGNSVRYIIARATAVCVIALVFTVALPTIEHVLSSALPKEDAIVTQDTAEPEQSYGRDNLPPSPILSGVAKEQPVPAVEMHLQIDRLGIDAPVVPVGMRSDGSMDIPADPLTVGWYTLGRRPGEPGNAVMAGHLDAPGGVRGVFWNLKELQVGDSILVREKGIVREFRVIDLQSFIYNEAPMKELFGENEHQFLRLITCTGVWNANEGMYAERLVVSAKAVSQ